MDHPACFLLLMLTMGIGSFTSCRWEIEPPLYLGQGLMAGEVTDQSVILQTRLTASDTLTNDDVPGRVGVVRFVVAKTEDFAQPVVQTDWMPADSANDFMVKTKINR